MSLRTRIAAAAGLAVAVVVLVAAAAIYVGVRAELRGEVDRSLRERAGAIAQRAGDRGRPGAGAGGPGTPGRPSRGARWRVPVAAPEPFGGAEGYRAARAPRRPRAAAARAQTRRCPSTPRARRSREPGPASTSPTRRVTGTHLRVLTRGAGDRGAVQVARPLDEVDRQLDRVLLVLLLVGAAGVALAARLWARSSRAPRSRPWRASRGAPRSSRPSPTRRSASTSSARDELGRLARSFNTTLDALERSVEAQRHLVADASHELRTPIASLRANIQTLEHADRLPAARARRVCGRTSSRSWTS